MSGKISYSNGHPLLWRVHTTNLFGEILNNPGASILHKPLVIYMGILEELATRCSQLNDPKLNALMVRLTLYEISDPHSKDYDPELVNDLLAKGYPKC